MKKILTILITTLLVIPVYYTSADRSTAPGQLKKSENTKNINQYNSEDQDKKTKLKTKLNTALSHRFKAISNWDKEKQINTYEKIREQISKLEERKIYTGAKAILLEILSEVIDDKLDELNPGENTGTGDTNTGTIESEFTTLSAINITDTCSTLKGSLVLNDSDEEDVYFKYGTDSGSLDTYTTPENMTSDGNFYKEVCDLDENTTYYFQANDAEILSFTTEETNYVESKFTTLSATGITDSCATLRGEILLNDSDEEDVYFKYGTGSTSLGTYTTPENMTSDGEFSTEICDLEQNTIYYFQANNGDILNFTTLETQE